MTAPFNPYAYGFPSVVVRDTLDAIQRICQLHYPTGNPPGWQEELADLALNMAARNKRYPIDMAISIMVDIDTTLAHYFQSGKAVQHPAQTFPASETSAKQEAAIQNLYNLLDGGFLLSI